MDYNKQRGIYGCYDESLDWMYIGSTSLSLSELEYNHRNWREKEYRKTNFREVLEQKGQGWRFVWVQKPKKCSVTQIEMEEGALIRAFVPTHNKDTDPYGSSIKYGRYEPI